jgi:hypothetical protein
LRCFARGIAREGSDLKAVGEQLPSYGPALLARGPEY